MWLWVRTSLLSLKLQLCYLLRTRSSLKFTQTTGCGFTLKVMRDMIITYCQMHRTGKYHFGSLAKWLSVLLRTKWLSVRISSLLFKLQIWRLQRARSSLTFRKTIDCGFTPKLVRDIRITYSLMHRTCKFSQLSSIIWSLWLNYCLFIYELGGCGFESRCCHLKFRYGPCFKQSVS